MNQVRNKIRSGLSRRTFIRGTASAIAGFTIVPRHVLGGARLVRQRVFEQPTVAEAMADSLLEVLELVAKADDPAPHLVAMTLDDARGFVGIRRMDRYPDLTKRVDGHRQDGLRVAGRADAVDAVTLEKCGHDTGFDF